jgi:glycosyltransferase involved in cell wall biosynthesis
VKNLMDAASAADLRVKLDTGLPASLPAGVGTAIFCCGTCFHPDRRVERLEISVDGVRREVTALRMPRLDLFRELHPTLSIEQGESFDRDPASSEDPAIRCYRSGFWALLPIEPHAGPGEIELRAVARLAGEETADAALGAIAVTDPVRPSSDDGRRTREGGRIAICMATFDPDMDLFRTQIDSLRAQTDANWICVISDDCSPPDRFEAIRKVVGEDPRFLVSRSERNIGFYRNFERALRMIPADVELVALCDQDDRWYPDKLATLRGAIGSAQLIYSDQRLVDAEGRVLRDTLWRRRRNNHTNLASLLIANTVVGASSLFRRRVVDYAVPFPEGPGWEFHDHWLALVAMTLGDVAYVDRPLYDYVQHPGAILGQVAASFEASGRSDARGRPGSRVWRWRGLFSRWRAAYFLAYIQLALQAQVLLARCSEELTARKRRALRLLVAAGRSPYAFAWLAARPIRALFGRNETLQTEELLARGILWRHLVALRMRGRERPTGWTHDASLPPLDPASFGLTRVKRWLGRH